jgi:glycosyltransferase involved in cell wall biosynthesis
MTICLNMIVKNEIEVIGRCLASVLSFIDYWVIVDTGSIDGTQHKIQEILKNIPGELYEKSWVNFEKNRNEALSLAKGKADYILFIDADETLSISEAFDKTQLHKDFYVLRLIERNTVDYFRISLIKDDPCWFWIGILHEVIDSSKSMSGTFLSSIVKNSSTFDGNRSKCIHSFLKDAAILAEALLKEPHNSRYVFYLAQSYGRAEKYEKSLHFYKQRTSMGGDPFEIYASFYYMGLIQQHLGKDSAEWIDSYSRAYQCKPTRAEPLFQLADYFFRSNQLLIGYFLAKAASVLPMPSWDGHFYVSIYEYSSLLVFARCAEGLQFTQEALMAYQQLLTRKLPQDIKQFVQTAIARL